MVPWLLHLQEGVSGPLKSNTFRELCVHVYQHKRTAPIVSQCSQNHSVEGCLPRQWLNADAAAVKKWKAKIRLQLGLIYFCSCYDRQHHWSDVAEDVLNASGCLLMGRPTELPWCCWESGCSSASLCIPWMGTSGYNSTSCARCCISSLWEWEQVLSSERLSSEWGLLQPHSQPKPTRPPFSPVPLIIHLPGPPCPHKTCCHSHSCLLCWLPLWSQVKLLSLSPSPHIMCRLTRQLCQIQKGIFDCSNVFMRAECSVIPLSSTSCVLITSEINSVHQCFFIVGTNHSKTFLEKSLTKQFLFKLGHFKIDGLFSARESQHC